MVFVDHDLIDVVPRVADNVRQRLTKKSWVDASIPMSMEP